MPPLKIMKVPCKSWIWKSRLHFPLNSPSPTDNKLTRAVTTQATVATPGAPASSFPRHPASSTSLNLREGRPHRAVPPLAGGPTSGWCQAHLQIDQSLLGQEGHFFHSPREKGGDRCKKFSHRMGKEYVEVLV